MSVKAFLINKANLHMSETTTLQFDHCCLQLSNVESNGLLQDFVGQHSDKQIEEVSQIDLHLNVTDNGFELLWYRDAGKPLSLHIEINKLIAQLRSFPAPKQGAFNQALGKKTQNVIDATGGWGGDALLMCLQGYRVKVLERHPLMALMLSEAMQRLGRTQWARQYQVIAPTVVHSNAIEYFKQADDLTEIDCVYLDPMFPPKKKKSAATNKNMQFLQWLLEHDHDADQLLESVVKSGAKRIAVKRPDYAQPLYCKPSTQFSSKLVHYDVYLAN